MKILTNQCFGINHMPNHDKIQRMAQEELAEDLARYIDCDCCFLRPRNKACHVENCKTAFLEWLQKEW